MSTIERTFLLPSDFVIVRKPSQLGTLLGSCVSVCLHNPFRGMAAMNHFMLPTAQGHPEVGRYGDSSTERIIKTLTALDPDPTHYTARIFGGAAVLGHLGAMGEIGDRNIDIARVVLNQFNIRVVQEEVGGTRGMRIDFFTETGKVESNLIGNATRTPLGAPAANVRVLIVDDSPLVRQILRLAIDGADGIEVVGEAADPFAARELILKTDPDVITLDIEMPRMDGITFLGHLMKSFPKPVVILSSIAKRGSKIHGQAIANGACGVLDKDDLQLFGGPEGLRKVVLPILFNAAKMGQNKTRKGA